MASSFSLISSSTELFSLGFQQRRQEYLATKDSPRPPASPSQLSKEHALPGPWTSTSSSPWTTMIFLFKSQLYSTESRHEVLQPEQVCASTALWAPVRMSVGKERARTRSLKCVGDEEREADGCFGDGGEKARGGGTSDDLPTYNIYHLRCPYAHPLYFTVSMHTGRGKKRWVELKEE